MRAPVLAVFLLCGGFAMANTYFDRDVFITSASQIDGAWSVTVYDSAIQKSSVFVVGQTRKRGGMTLLSFDREACTASLQTPRGTIRVSLAERKALTAQASAMELEEQHEADEIIAASNGKVTARHRAALWKRSGQ